jgi:hypothetical protein
VTPSPTSPIPRQHPGSRNKPGRSPPKGHSAFSPPSPLPSRMAPTFASKAKSVPMNSRTKTATNEIVAASILTLRSGRKLFDQSLKWIHFFRNPSEPEVRAQERRVLIDIVMAHFGC